MFAIQNNNYIFQTGDTVKSRVHKQQIAHKEFRMLGMSQHISICGRNKQSGFLAPSSIR